MPEYLSPGVYIEELSTGPKPIEGVSTSTAGFVGMTERGPTEVQMVTSWLEFQRWYGGYLPTAVSYLPYAVQGFFDNGGQRLFIKRVVGDAMAPVASTFNFGNLKVTALGPGTWGDQVFVGVKLASQRDDAANPPKNPDWFSLVVLYYHTMPPLPLVDPTDLTKTTDPDRRQPDVIEVFDNLVHTPGANNEVQSTVNPASHLVRVEWTGGPAVVPVTDFTQLGGGASANADANALNAGLDELEAFTDISLLAIPDEVLFADVRTNLINQCEKLTDRFAVLSATAREIDVNSLRPPRDSTFGAFYYPWIEVYDPVSRGPIKIPPTGHITGLIARTDIERGVHKAPANDVVRDARKLVSTVTKGQQDLLNPRGVNCIRDFSSMGRGIRLWGARTMSSDPEWRYVNVRRLFIFVEQSILRGTQWVVFEPNDTPLWGQVRRSIVNFLTLVWRSGALAGLAQEEAFFVKCDRTTMTQADIDAGRLICYIGIAPVKPAEFVIFRISQKTAEAQA